MDFNAVNTRTPAQRPDGRWGITNDFTGESRYAGPGYDTREEAERAIEGEK
jgi:hypothetical protein